MYVWNKKQAEESSTYKKEATLKRLYFSWNCTSLPLDLSSVEVWNSISDVGHERWETWLLPFNSLLFPCKDTISSLTPVATSVSSNFAYLKPKMLQLLTRGLKTSSLFILKWHFTLINSFVFSEKKWYTTAGCKANTLFIQTFSTAHYCGCN